MGTPARAAGEKKYLKSDLAFFGVTVPALRRIARAFHREHAKLGRADLLPIVEALWATRCHELWMLGVFLLHGYAPLLQARDMQLIEALLRRATSWAHVDGLAVKVAGDLVHRFARARRTLVRWAADESMWLRRASLWALLDDLRGGAGDFDLFARLANPMLSEREFFIRKAIGWVLREVSKKRPHLTYGSLERHIDRVSGLTFREASKYLPASQRQRLDRRRKKRALTSKS